MCVVLLFVHLSKARAIQCDFKDSVRQSRRHCRLSHIKSHFISINGSKPENVVLR